MAKATISVLLATRNRSQALRRTLQGYCRVAPPTVPWQLVVVDNGSSDETQTVLRLFQDRLPLEDAFHKIAGKNGALNRGIDLLDGDLVVVSDDDSIPDPDFLQAWQNVMDRHPGFELFGGRIEPSYQQRPPRWLRRASPHLLAMMFSKRDLPEGPIEPGEIYGCNMAVRASVFEAGHRFFEGIGPNGADPDYAMGSEVEFCRRVAQAGAQSWFARAPMVQHLVTPSQWSQDAWIGRGYRLGRGRARLMLLEGRSGSAPRVDIATRLAALTPLARHRYPALNAISLARGFRDEIAANRGAGTVLHGSSRL